MTPEGRVASPQIDPDETVDPDTIDLQEVEELKLRGERLLEESRSLNDMSRALLQEIDPPSV